MPIEDCAEHDVLISYMTLFFDNDFFWFVYPLRYYRHSRSGIPV